MQVQKCDECGKIGNPGETWVSVSVSPHYLRGNGAYYAEEPMEVSGGPSRGGTTCSPVCAVERLRRGFQDLLVYAEEMLDNVSLLGDELIAAKPFVTKP
jgi:hypothetical protein